MFGLRSRGIATLLRRALHSRGITTFFLGWHIIRVIRINHFQARTSKYHHAPPPALSTPLFDNNLFILYFSFSEKYLWIWTHAKCSIVIFFVQIFLILHQFNLFFVNLLFEYVFRSNRNLPQICSSNFSSPSPLRPRPLSSLVEENVQSFALGFFVGKTIFGSNFDVFRQNLAKSSQKLTLEHQNRALETLVKFWNRALKPYVKIWNRVLKTLAFLNPKP